MKITRVLPAGSGYRNERDIRVLVINFVSAYTMNAS